MRAENDHKIHFIGFLNVWIRSLPISINYKMCCDRCKLHNRIERAPILDIGLEECPMPNFSLIPATLALNDITEQSFDSSSRLSFSRINQISQHNMIHSLIFAVIEVARSHSFNVAVELIRKSLSII